MTAGVSRLRRLEEAKVVSESFCHPCVAAHQTALLTPARLISELRRDDQVLTDGHISAAPG